MPLKIKSYPPFLPAANQERLERVRRAAEEKAAEAASALAKVRGRFFDDVLFPRIVVKGIR